LAYEAFKEERVALEVQHQLQGVLVFAQEGVINRNYEGSVKYAKSVRLTGIGGVTVFDVTDNVDMPDPEIIADTDTHLTIDFHKGYNFKIPKKDEEQTRINLLDEVNIEAAYAVADAVDLAVASCYVDASASNLVGSDASPKTPNVTKGDASNIFKLITDCGTKLKKSKVPAATPKWMIIPPEMEALIVNDLHDQGSSAPTVATPAILNGSIGHIGGFELLVSNNVPNTNGTLDKILFGTKNAITFASQVDDTRILPMEKQYARKVDGQYVFGRKVVKPACLGVMTCNFN
jgi:hypothetical protein